MSADVTLPLRLDDLASKINNASSAAEANARSAMEHALVAGRLLTEAKGLLVHGDWLPWSHGHCTLAPRTAQAYMRLARKIELLPPLDAQRVADLPVREAVRAISTEPEAPPRATALRVTSRTDAERAASTFKRTADALRKATSLVRLGRINARNVEQMRQRLEQALQELDRLTEVNT